MVTLGGESIGNRNVPLPDACFGRHTVEAIHAKREKADH